MAVDTTDDIRTLLAGTTVPTPTVDRLLDAAPPLWLASAPAAVLAADLALAHPPLAPGEVRAVARPLVGGGQRLVVLAEDRRGLLLADTAAAISSVGLPVLSASAATWLGDGLALHALTVDDEGHGAPTWDDLGARLRSVGHGARPAVAFRPLGRAKVECQAGADDCLAVTIDAPDAPGLLAATCGWLADAGIAIDALHAETVDGRAHDVLLVRDEPDVEALAAYLSTPAGVRAPFDVRLLAAFPARVTGHVVRAAWRTATGP